jgi:hypothetical protein
MEIVAECDMPKLFSYNGIIYLAGLREGLFDLIGAGFPSYFENH